MIKRFGSTGLATILGIGGLFAVGVGSFAAYKSYNGCGSCCSGKDAAVTTPVVLTEGAEAADSCCSAEKAEKAASCAAACEGEAKAACATSGACCKGKAAEDCCKSGGEKSECSGEKAVQEAEPTAAGETKASCPLCPSKTKG